MLGGVTRPMLLHLPGVPHLHVNRLLIFSNKDESDTFSGEKSTMMKHSGFFFYTLTRKNFKSIFVLVLDLESKGLLSSSANLA